MQPTAASSSSQNKKIATKSRHLNTDDTDSDDHDSQIRDAGDLDTPWLAEWNRYKDTCEALADEMGIVRWWGVRLFKISRYFETNRLSEAQCATISNVGLI